jgi:hypothetical protein
MHMRRRGLHSSPSQLHMRDKSLFFVDFIEELPGVSSRALPVVP